MIFWWNSSYTFTCFSWIFNFMSFINFPNIGNVSRSLQNLSTHHWQFWFYVYLFFHRFVIFSRRFATFCIMSRRFGIHFVLKNKIKWWRQGPGTESTQIIFNKWPFPFDQILWCLQKVSDYQAKLPKEEHYKWNASGTTTYQK